MKINANQVLKGSKAILVPYRKEHVDIYHEWMKSPFLLERLEMTASEPLSLQEEYDMQASWYEDSDKCTFILLNESFKKNRISGMSGTLGGLVGDVNLYFNDHDDTHSAEIEVMIAEPDVRRTGIGLNALLLMMRYGIETLGVTTFTAKISLSNEASLALFRNALGFEDVSVSEVFGEVTLRLKVTEELRRGLVERAAWEKMKYSPEIAEA
ncbi:n-acetyltransferase 9 [Chytridium lagenaria]|nr:n-acetyltransferase 9 [Chytridium lagenaria]